MAKRVVRQRRWWLWATRPGNWVQVITCVGVLGGLTWTGIQHYSVSKPMTDASIKQIVQELELAAERRAEMRASTRLANATAADLKDPVRVKISEVQLKTAQLQEAKEVDELLSSITPDIGIRRGESAQLNDEVLLELILTNGGQRVVLIDTLSLQVIGIGGTSGSGKPVRARLDACKPQAIAPKATKSCIVAIPIPEMDEYDKVSFRFSLGGRTDPNVSQKSVALLDDSLPQELVEARLKQNFRFDGIWIFAD